MTLNKDVENYVKYCDTCQKFDKVPHLPSVPQTTVLAVWPFDMWGIDLMSKFPKARGNHEYFLHDFVLC